MTQWLDVADLAAEQWGLITTAQAASIGVSAQTMARLANQGALQRLGHGIYRVAGAPFDPGDGLRAAWLGLDPGRRVAERRADPSAAVVSHRSAARLHGLGDLDADSYEFTVSGRKQSRRPDVRLHRGSVTADDRTVVDGLPVTTVARTVADLAAARTDGDHLAAVVVDAVMAQRSRSEDLALVLRPYANRYGAPLGDGEALVTGLLERVDRTGAGPEARFALVEDQLREAVLRAVAENIDLKAVASRIGGPRLRELLKALESGHDERLD
ncbi:type IV toxin-antitoxin system AbiEi family antitoxin domain-containing protein [Jiangella endophytica]|uniref:type IV toxin-antitoxin system AbiEi family antitoxin domain-containing protein n=1 Tax=Jiangella endophytica TaxID=1623398 RepID=UPI000E353F5E|nr:type IV toxin-antitoxin system AbiEi family antitoxin domain-containing protein [Jiangella endophytica]